MTHDGMIKRSKLKEFKLLRYSKETSCMKLKDNDYVIAAFTEEKPCLFLTTDSGYGLSFKMEEVPVVGVKASGVKAIKLKDDNLVSANQYSENEDEFIAIITDKGTGKRVRLNEFELSTRTRRGLLVIREVKTNPYKVLKTFITDSKNFIGLKNNDINIVKLTELPISDRHSIGSQLTKHNLIDVFQEATLIRSTKEQIDLIADKEITKIETVEEKEEKPKKEKISLKEIDDRLMTIDDFLN